jgi:hypothetical protein
MFKIQKWGKMEEQKPEHPLSNTSFHAFPAQCRGLAAA